MTETAWRDLRVRVISAAILTPLALLALWFGGLPWKLWLDLGVMGMSIEWFKLTNIKLTYILTFGLVPLILVTQDAAAKAPSGAFVLVVVFALLAALISKRVILGLGFIYIWPTFISLLVMRNAQAGFRNVLFLVLVVWGTDIGAYLVGRLVGGPRLAPRISPGKTWSGTIGGLAAAAIVGAAAGFERPLIGALLALLLSVIAQAGDLLESAIKRHFGVKDSGTLIPGHGGLLDRLDGVLTAAPAAFLWSISVTPHAMLWMVAS